MNVPDKFKFKYVSGSYTQEHTYTAVREGNGCVRVTWDYWSDDSQITGSTSYTPEAASEAIAEGYWVIVPDVEGVTVPERFKFILSGLLTYDARAIGNEVVIWRDGVEIARHNIKAALDRIASGEWTIVPKAEEKELTASPNAPVTEVEEQIATPLTVSELREFTKNTGAEVTACGGHTEVIYGNYIAECHSEDDLRKVMAAIKVLDEHVSEQ